jgi:hypothetical protein
MENALFLATIIFHQLIRFKTGMGNITTSSTRNTNFLKYICTASKIATFNLGFFSILIAVKPAAPPLLLLYQNFDSYSIWKIADDSVYVK